MKVQFAWIRGYGMEVSAKDRSYKISRVVFMGKDLKKPVSTNHLQKLDGMSFEVLQETLPLYRKDRGAKSPAACVLQEPTHSPTLVINLDKADVQMDVSYAKSVDDLWGCIIHGNYTVTMDEGKTFCFQILLKNFIDQVMGAKNAYDEAVEQLGQAKTVEEFDELAVKARDAFTHYMGWLDHAKSYTLEEYLKQTT